jgi:hypothetical protein
MNFGINQETRGAVIAPFETTSENRFHIALLKDVIVDDKHEVKSGTNKGNIITVLKFVFVSPDGKRGHTQQFSPLDTSSEKWSVAHGIMAGKIKHILETYTTIPTEGIGEGAKTYDDFFKEVRKAFYTIEEKPATEEGGQPTKVEKAVFAGKKVWIYLTYDNTGRLQFPTPNFIEKYVEGGKPATLFSKQNDVLDRPTKAKTVPGAVVTGGRPSEDDLPDGF